MPSTRLFATVIGLALATATAGMAQTFNPDPVDRAAAVREGNLTWYSSTPFPLVQQLADKFQQETGIKVQLLRLGGESVLRRFMQEYHAGQPGADVITISNTGAAIGMTRQGMFIPFRPDGFDKIPNEAKDPQGHWFAQRLDVIGMPVRTDKVAESDRPKTWSDLTNPKYKGMMIMPDPSFTAIQLTVVSGLSQKLGWDFYRGLRQNDIMIVQGHQQVYKAMQQGERLIAAEGVEPRSYNDGKEVPNQTMVYPTEGAFLIVPPFAIVKYAPHPNAAKLFAQFINSPAAQALLTENAIYPARTDIPPPAGQPALTDLRFIPSDIEQIEAKGRELKATFNEIFQ